MLSRFIHLLENVFIPLLFAAKHDSIVYTYHIAVTHESADGALGWSYVLATVSRAAVTMDLQESP